MTKFFKKFIPLVVAISLIFGLGAGIFIKKARAQAGGQQVTTAGQAVGKAVAAGAACFLASKLESWGMGFLTRTTAIPEGYAQMAKYPVAVPVVVLNNPAVAMSGETSNALAQSKDCIRDVIAKILLDWIVDETVKWIQNGGEPQFITNWDGFFQDATNVAVGEVIYQTNAAFLCSPFKLQVNLSLGAGTNFQQKINCTLDKIVNNIENFYVDFNNGGWAGYTSLWQPQNNYYGVMLLTYDEMINKAAAAKLTAVNEAIAGSGFLSVKRCKGGGISSDAKFQMESDSPNSTAGFVKDSKGNWCLGNQLETQTPGSTVGEAAAKAITTDSDWAANIKSWVAAIADAIISRLISDGLNLMRGSGEPSSAGDFDPYVYYNKHNLTVVVNPSAAGSVSGAGAHDKGSTATITAVANSGYRFDSWSGDATGNSPTARVVMDRDKFVIANFATSSLTSVTPPVDVSTCQRQSPIEGVPPSSQCTILDQIGYAGDEYGYGLERINLTAGGTYYYVLPVGEVMARSDFGYSQPPFNLVNPNMTQLEAHVQAGQESSETWLSSRLFAPTGEVYSVGPDKYNDLTVRSSRYLDTPGVYVVKNYEHDYISKENWILEVTAIRDSSVLINWELHI